VGESWLGSRYKPRQEYDAWRSLVESSFNPCGAIACSSEPCILALFPWNESAMEFGDVEMMTAAATAKIIRYKSPVHLCPLYLIHTFNIGSYSLKPQILQFILEMDSFSSDSPSAPQPPRGSMRRIS
jgi:hypothetical protein